MAKEGIYFILWKKKFSEVFTSSIHFRNCHALTHSEILSTYVQQLIPKKWLKFRRL